MSPGAVKQLKAALARVQGKALKVGGRTGAGGHLGVGRCFGATTSGMRACACCVCVRANGTVRG